MLVYVQVCFRLNLHWQIQSWTLCMCSYTSSGDGGHSRIGVFCWKQDAIAHLQEWWQSEDKVSCRDALRGKLTFSPNCHLHWSRFAGNCRVTQQYGSIKTAMTSEPRLFFTIHTTVMRDTSGYLRISTRKYPPKVFFYFKKQTEIYHILYLLYILMKILQIYIIPNVKQPINWSLIS